MAIAKIKRIEVIGLQKDKEELLSLTQKLGLVELINIAESPLVSSAVALGAEINLLEIEEAISYLDSFKERRPILAGMVRFKSTVEEGKLREVIASFDYSAFLKELTKLRNHLKNLSQYREHLVAESNLLAPWRNLKIPLDEPRYTKSCGILLGVLPQRNYQEFLGECHKAAIDIFSEAVNQDNLNMYMVIIHLTKDFEKLEAILKKCHFNFVTLSPYPGSIEERLLEIKQEISTLDSQIETTKVEISKLAQEQFKLMVVYDYLANIKGIRQADKDLSLQKFTFFLKGWIKEKDLKRFKESIEGKFKNVELFVLEPKTDEEIPVDLENPPLLKPFEFITKIYGFPHYREVDPTPYLAPFFFLYFGFCISDVGYGFILALFSFFVLKKFKLGPQGLRFFRLFLFCGISTIIIGAFTGSWFGNVFDLLAENNRAFTPLKKFKDALILLDPVKEPTKLLGIALSFGIIQVWFGNLVAAIGNIKNRRYLNVLFDQVTMLTLLFGLTGSGLIFLKLLDNARLSLFRYAVLIGAFSLLLTQGRSEKGLGAKLFYGLYNLYNALSGYLSDILSYSRLWALGLVTGVMATTINLISVQFSQIFVSTIPFLSKVELIKTIISMMVLILIFVSGHLVSFLMNLLGAFVHPVRLQFVEFFSKFFKTSGRPFKPFTVETKYIDFS